MKSCFLFGLFVTAISAAKFPEDLPRCRPGDSECLPRIMTEIIRNNPNGHSGLGIPTLEPLRINRIDIKQGTDSPIAINLNFQDLDLAGMSGVIVTRVDGFTADPRTSKYEVHATVPKIDINGKYKINGRVLVLPIQGDGKANLIFDNVNLIVRYKPRIVEKKGKTYIQTDKFALDFNTTRLHIKLDNLFNGDKALGDNMNLFLNENWQDILNELKPAVKFAIEELFKGIINRIFLRIPYNDIFIE